MDVISHTVITESFTGNPFGEVGLTHRYKGLYLGEPKIVEVIKSFFDRFHVTDSEVISYSEQEEREGRDHVYFYNSGNIVVSFGGQRLFDLYAREKSDRHYNYYCSEILSIFRRNPLKWEPGSIRGKGFFRTGDNLYFFDGGKLLGLKWDRNYFKKLARAGWDPDKLEGILVNLKPEEMEGDKSAGVMNFVKRGIAARNPMTFFSRDKQFSGKIEPLFEYVQSRDVPIRFLDISSRGAFEWNGTPGEWNNETFTFQLNSEVSVKINEQGDASLHFGEVNCDCTLADNVPSRILSETPGKEKLKDLYIDGMAKVIIYSDMKGDEVRFVREAAQVVQTLYDSLNQGRTELTSAQEKCLGEMKRLVRNAGRSGDARMSLFGSNCVVFLRLLAVEESPLSGIAEEAASLIEKQIKPPVEQAVSFLFSADYYREGCFYLPYKMDISPGDQAKAQEMHDALIQCDKKEVDFFFAERKRLDAILGALNKGTLWDDMKKHSEAQATVVEQKTKTPASSSSRKTTSSTASSPAAQTSGVKTTPGKSKSQSRGGSRWYLWLLLLLLLPLGFLGYDFFFRGDDSFVKNTLSGGSSMVSGEGGEEGDSTSGGLDDSSLTSGGDAVSPSGDSSEGNGVNEDGSTPDGDVSAGTDARTDGSSLTVGAVRDENGVNGDSEREGNEKGDDIRSDSDSTNNSEDRGNGTVLTGEEEVPDASPLSASDSEVVPAANGIDDPEVVFRDTEETIVTKPFVMDNHFLDDFEVGGIRITMADIHLKANAISVMNGYRDLGFHIVDGADPTIIEPGQVLKLPGNLTYKVKPDDNIWYIAA
ncbi:MAG: hypothetical protein PQJ60_14910, partial [Spirochaetales bacterium]|nr:hypothetical protein [Spirochaetales bacterium]